MIPFNGRNIQRNDSAKLLASAMNLPPISCAQAATILFLAMEPEKVDDKNEESSKMIKKFGDALREGNLEIIRKALTLKLFKIKSYPSDTNSSPSRQSVLDSNFSENDDAISEEEEDVLRCYEIFRLLSIKPIPQFLVEHFDKVVAAKKIAARSDSQQDDLKTFFVYTESSILREVCELLTPKDVARLCDSIRNEKCLHEISEDLKTLTVNENLLCTVEGLKEVAFYFLVLHMIQAKKINRLYTHELQFMIKTVQTQYVSEGVTNVSRFEESIGKLKKYPVSSHPPGICLIFTMNSERKGSENDVQVVKGLFEKDYRYDVILKVNPSKKDIETVISKLKAPRNKFYDSLVVWFMGHGSLKFLHVSDGEIERRRNFIEPLTKIKWFNKKPKLFFIQACRQEERSARKMSQRSNSAMEADTDASAIGLGTGPNWNSTYGSFIDFECVNHYADTLTANAANWPDTYAARNQQGSLWVQTLIDLLNTRGHKESIENVLRDVHYNVNTIALTTEEMEWKQTPFYDSSLQKEFIFPRSYEAVEVAPESNKIISPAD